MSVAVGIRSQFTMNVEVSHTHAHIGDDFMATCRVTNKQRKPYFIYWERKIDGHTVTIASNNITTDDFHVGRYSATMTMAAHNDVSEVTFRLMISDLEGADSGEIGCRIPSQHIEVFKELTVFVPVKTVKLTSQYSNGTHAVAYVDGQVVSFHEGDSRRLFCHVNGSYPNPKVDIMIGDKIMTGNFNEEVRLVKKGRIRGLQDLTYEVTLSNNELVLDYAFSNKELKCVATIPGSGFSAKSMTIDVKIAGYKPRFECDDTVLSRIHENSLNITCVVHANPAVNKANVYWSRFSSGDPVTLGKGQENGHYAAFIETGSSGEEIKMILRIDRVFTQHFRKYYFHAENDLGNSTFAVTLVQEGTYQLKSSTTALWIMHPTLFALVTAGWML